MKKFILILVVVIAILAIAGGGLFGFTDWFNSSYTVTPPPQDNEMVVNPPTPLPPAPTMQPFLFNLDGTVNVANAEAILEALDANDRETSFRLFPVIGSGATALLSVIEWRIVDSRNNQLTMWASGNYRVSQFNDSVQDEPSYYTSLLRANLLSDFEPILNAIPNLTNHILPHGTTVYGIEYDLIWVPGGAQLGSGVNSWGLNNALRIATPASVSWQRSRNFTFTSMFVVLSVGTYNNARPQTNYEGVRPALHLDLQALRDAIS